MINLRDLTDEQLDAHRIATLTEQERRAKLEQLPGNLADMARDAAGAGCSPDELLARVTEALTEPAPAGPDTDTTTTTDQETPR